LCYEDIRANAPKSQFLYKAIDFRIPRNIFNIKLQKDKQLKKMLKFSLVNRQKVIIILRTFVTDFGIETIVIDSIKRESGLIPEQYPLL